MGTGLCLVGTPLGVTVFLLLTGSCRITLINGGCRGLLWGSCSGLRCRCAASILGCIILAALAPELRPRLSRRLASLLHIGPLSATRLHRWRFGSERRETGPPNEQCTQGNRNRFNFHVYLHCDRARGRPHFSPNSLRSQGSSAQPGTKEYTSHNFITGLCARLGARVTRAHVAMPVALPEEPELAA
jgi:hypothetical protein